MHHDQRIAAGGGGFVVAGIYTEQQDREWLKVGAGQGFLHRHTTTFGLQAWIRLLDRVKRAGGKAGEDEDHQAGEEQGGDTSSNDRATAGAGAARGADCCGPLVAGTALGNPITR